MKDLTKGNEGKSIFLFAMPMLIGSLFQQLYNTTDSIIVGRFIGKNAMAAVSGANPIMFLLTSLLTGIGLGFSILLSQFYGSKDMEKVKATIDSTYIFLFVSSLIITLIGVFFSEPILRIMDTPAEILQQSKLYLIVIFSGTLFSAGYNSISSILRGLGDSTTPLYFLILSTIINIILDIVFIINFKMGVEGVALATIISQGISFVTSVIYLNKKHSILKLKFKGLVYDSIIFKTGLKLGIPTAIQQMLFSFGNIALQSLVNSYGTSAMAAFGAGCRIETFISIPIMNLGSAVSTFVAQNMGAGETERVKKGVNASVKMALALSAFVAVVFVIFAKQLIGLFSTDSEVITIGASYLSLLGPFFVFICISFMLTSAIRGSGDSVVAMIISVCTLWLFRIPSAYLLSKFFSVKGIWMGIAVGWIAGFFITYVYYKSGRWKTKSIVNHRVDEDNYYELNEEVASTSPSKE